MVLCCSITCPDPKQAAVGDVTNAWCEFETQQGPQREDMLGVAVRVGVMLLDVQVALVVQKPVEHEGRVAFVGTDDLRVKRCVLIADVRVERHTGRVTVPLIDPSVAVAVSASFVVLSVTRGGRTVTPECREWLSGLEVREFGERIAVRVITHKPVVQPAQSSRRQAR